MIVSSMRADAAACAILCGAALFLGVPGGLFAGVTGGSPKPISVAQLQELRLLTHAMKSAAASSTAGFPRDTSVQALTLQTEVAKKRRQLMENVAEKNPQVFLRNIIGAAARAKLPPALQAEVEQEVVLTGSVDVLHIDDFSTERNSRFVYTLNAGSERLALHPAGNAPALSSGTIVQVKGYRIGGKVVADAQEAAIKILKKRKLESAAVENTLVILITSAGLPATPTKAQMKQLIFSGNFGKYYEEQSYGKIKFVGDVTDWISVPAASNPGCASPQFDQPEVKNYILQKKIKLSAYGRIVFVVNGWAGGCAFVGKFGLTFNGITYQLSQGWVGWPDEGWQKQNMSGFEYVLSHEMGHELGVMHANSWSCTGPSLDTGCYHSEYGNSFDVMGTGYAAEHFNAFYKDLLGWLATSSKAFVTRPGSYTLSPIEVKTGIRAAVITNPSVPLIAPLYLEFRRPLGFDSVLPPSSAGIHINQVIPDYYPFPRLINANYAIDPNSQQALMPGGSFAWESHGISVRSLIIRNSLASFYVAVKPAVCRLLGIAIGDIYEQTQLTSGSFGSISFSLTNNDYPSCAPSTLSIVTTISGGEDWSISQYPDSIVTLSPGTPQYMYVSFMAPATVTGTRTLTITITDAANSRKYSLVRTLTISAPPHIDTILPVSGIGGTAITLFGSGFDTSRNGNNIYIQGSSVSSNLSALPSASSTMIMFTFPSTIEDYRNGFPPLQIPTPAGIYTITLSRAADGGTSNPVTFDVTATSSVAMGTSPYPAANNDLMAQLANVFSAFGTVLKVWMWVLL